MGVRDDPDLLADAERGTGAADGPVLVVRLARRGVRVLRWCPRSNGVDNPKTGVDRPDLYDPKSGRAYAELAAFYGLLIDPARVGKPKDKPRIERPMPYIRDSFFKGREFTSLAQMQDAALKSTVSQRFHRDHSSRSSIGSGRSPRTVMSRPARPCIRCPDG